MNNLTNAETELLKFYQQNKRVISRRSNEFKKLWRHGDEQQLFAELAFCLFTPQSKAKACWDTVLILRQKGLLLEGTPPQISKELARVRFRNNKARYLVQARKLFCSNSNLCIRENLAVFTDNISRRQWLLQNVKGLGLKESSHFLRNIGLDADITILDRHILRNLHLYGVIDEVPASLSPRRYTEIEQAMLDFARHVQIPAVHLDLLLWSKETGEVFK